MKHQIEALSAADWPEVSAIYMEGLATGLATFETTVPSWELWNQGHLEVGRLVARAKGKVIGWVALSPTSQREVYSGVNDESIYVAASARGMGVGKSLLEALVKASEEAGIWSLQAGIFRENKASLALHRNCGFRVIGHQERKGCLNGVWHDVFLMERRSDVVGM
ncbi:MAG: N-acetyltransferase [SAR202 cluster bacterium Io17-Chloro-G4]|nr:MAG: N-acetyltransferase [SAR202 cluster bacterium Io17-Chloro-G4]